MLLDKVSRAFDKPLLKNIVLVVFLCLAVSSAGSTSLRQAEAATMPNIVFILTDDLNERLLQRYIDSYPHIRSLTTNGMKFNSAFVTNPVCCPSRATSLTGQYTHNHGIEQDATRSEGRFAETLESKALPVWMKNAGYTTFYVGRYLNGYDGEHVPLGWDVWKGTRLESTGGEVLVPGYDEKGRNAQGKTHTQVFAKKGASFIRARADGHKPMFLYVAPYAPHVPPAYPKRYETLFAGERVPRTDSFNEEDVSDKPGWVRSKPKLTKAQIAGADATYRNMARSTKDIDQMVAKIVSALRDTGELENTYIFFTSDNGFHLGTHRLAAGKWTAYEEDISVPLIIRGPGIEHGSKTGEITLNNDLAPTFADLAGAQPMLEVDGSSLAPLFHGEYAPRSEAFLIKAIADRSGDRPAFHAVRTHEHIFIEYATGERELYDLTADPRQLDNAYWDVDPAVRAELQAKLDTLKTCSGAGCREAY